MPQWSVQRAEEWHAKHGWRVGVNYIPSTAENQLEHWQAETFDLVTIERELTWAQGLGLNTIRVFLHYLPYQLDAAGFIDRINKFLSIADSKGIKTFFVLFDDCWNKEFAAGKQPDPIPGVHNSQWVQCPGEKRVTDQSAWPILEEYTKGILNAFKNDNRVLFWGNRESFRSFYSIKRGANYLNLSPYST